MKIIINWNKLNWIEKIENDFLFKNKIENKKDFLSNIDKIKFYLKKIISIAVNNNNLKIAFSNKIETLFNTLFFESEKIYNQKSKEDI